MKNISKNLCIISLVIISFICFISNLKVSAFSNYENYLEVTYEDLYKNYNINTDGFVCCQENNARTVSNTFYVNYQYQLINGEYVYYTLYFEFYSGFLYTPNGTDVALPNSSDPTTYFVMKYLNDIPNVVKNDLEYVNSQTYDGISLISESTTSYNCHSYAWYSQNILDNDIWISFPTAYYMDSDESYERVYDPKVGDIICYIDNDQEEPYRNIHSGIIVDYSGEDSNNICGDSNKYIIQSKWGSSGLYQHKGDDCPYTSKYQGDGPDAEEVWYFRRIKNTYSLGNYISGLNKTIMIDSNNGLTERNETWKLDIDYTKKYEFIINGNSALNIGFYDDNMQLISVIDLNENSNCVHFEEQLEKDKTYYLSIAYENKNYFGSISVQINFKPDLSLGNNNVLSAYRSINYDYVFTNNISAGFYKITLNATNSLGTIDYPEACIKVYADEAKQQMLARLETIFYTLDAETQGDSNNLIVFLEYGESYYINIDLPSDTYSSMNINIERLSNTYDIIESDIDEEHVILNENTTAYGDYIQRIEILEAGTYTIAFTHEGPQSEENLSGQEDPLYLYYAFYKEVSSPAEQFGDLEMIFPHIASSMGGTISFTFNLQPGVYYIGYYNKLNNEPMTISITS